MFTVVSTEVIKVKSEVAYSQRLVGRHGRQVRGRGTVTSRLGQSGVLDRLGRTISVIVHTDVGICGECLMSCYLFVCCSYLSV